MFVNQFDRMRLNQQVWYQAFFTQATQNRALNIKCCFSVQIMSSQRPFFLGGGSFWVLLWERSSTPSEHKEIFAIFRDKNLRFNFLYCFIVIADKVQSKYTVISSLNALSNVHYCPFVSCYVTQHIQMNLSYKITRIFS